MPFDFGTANKAQKSAVTTTEGPVLIIAGPGTGKTFTLVKRAVYLITEKNIAPENIMIATFTEKAAKEIITRISNELLDIGINININELYIGTIHSICLRLIKENLEFTRLKRNYRLLDEFEQLYFVFQNMKTFDAIPDIDLFYGKLTKSWDKAEHLTYYINAVSEELVTTETLASHSENLVQTLSKIIAVYDKMLEEENALDFSGIQSIAYNLLIGNHEICRKIQESIKYIMIDEYQDTNYVQEQFVFLLGKEHKNICVVGDDDQGLYRFRGATIRNILEFPQHFPNAKQITLRENYRLEKDIVSFYNSWMEATSGRGFSFEWDEYRYNKNITPSKNTFIEGTPTVIKAGSKDDWNNSVLELINELKESGKISNLNQIAFLFRSVKNERVKALADFLEANGVPVYSPRSALFFDRLEIQLIIGALMLCFPDYVTRLNKGEMAAPPDLQEFYKSCVLTMNEFLKNPQYEELKKFIQFRARDHVAPTKNCDYAFTGLLYRLLQFEPFKSYMDLDLKGMVDTRPLRNLAIFSNLTSRYEYLHHITIFTAKSIGRDADFFFSMFMRFLKDGGINEYEDEAEYAPSGCVSFMTVHQSKGLEFPVVIVGSLYARPTVQGTNITRLLENEVYHRKPFEPFDSIKYFDFWRLYYTAFSRAQNLLVLTSPEKGGSWADPSKYFENIYCKIPYYFDSSVDFSKYKFETVREVNLKQSFSFTSHVMLYENCAMQYKYFKELGFDPVETGSTFFGNLVHQTIEDIHRCVLKGEQHNINEIKIKEWFESNYVNLSKRERTYLQKHVQDAALNQVMRYAEKQHGDWEKVVDAELEVSHVEKEYILKGKIDLIQGESDTVEIIDFKSERKPDMENEKDKIERYHRQLQLYAYIIEQKYDKPVSKMHIYYTGETDGIPTISFNNRASEMTRTMMAIDKTVQRIRGKDFSGKSSSDKICQYCDIRYYCNKV